MRNSKKSTVKKVLLGIFLLIFALFGGLFVLNFLTAPSNPDLQPIGFREWFGNPAPVDVNALPLKMKVAAVSMQSVREKEKNILTIGETVAEIMRNEPDTRLIVFGEAALGLYFDPENPRQYQKEIAETIPGAATENVGAAAKTHRVYIAFGMIEKDGESLFNSFAVINPDGEIVGKHRKMLLFYLDEQNGIVKAEPNSQVIDIEGFRVGLAICSDANSKWLIEDYRKKDIDVLLYSVTSSVPWLSLKLEYWFMSRRFDAWIIAANRFGAEGRDEYPGTIFIADPNGAMQAISRQGVGYITKTIGKDR